MPEQRIFPPSGEPAVDRLISLMVMHNENLTNALQQQTNALTKMSEKIDATAARVIRLEEQRHGQDIARLEASIKELDTELQRKGAAADVRLQALEILRAQASGVGAAMGWFRSWAPLIAAGLVILFGFFGVEKMK